MGVLGKCQVSAGDYVSVTQKLVSLTDINHLRIEYTVPEKYLSQLKLGQEIKITTSVYPNKIFHGKIAFISPTINTQDRTISLYADVDNEEKSLTAGLFANVTHQLGIAREVIAIPPTSLVPTIEGQQVFKIVDNKAVSVPVTILQRSENSVQVDAALKPGDQIVIAGQMQLKEGMSVQIEKKTS